MSMQTSISINLKKQNFFKLVVPITFTVVIDFIKPNCFAYVLSIKLKKLQHLC